MNDSEKLPMKPARLSREVIYESPWVNLYADKVVFPQGRVVDRHYLLDFEKEAVAAVVENDREQVLLIRSYRYPTDSIGWEIPAGGVEAGESVLETARREILEETGWVTEKLESIYTYNPMNGMTNKVFHIVTCRAVTDTGDFDRNEVKDLKWCTWSEVGQMIAQKEIRDGFTLTGLLLKLCNKG